MATKAASKSEIFQRIVDATGLKRKDVASVFDALKDAIQKELGKKGPGMFTLPGLLKIVRVHKPATPAREGMNPFTKQMQTFKAKPARNIVRAKALKSLKDMVK